MVFDTKSHRNVAVHHADGHSQRYCYPTPVTQSDDKWAFADNPVTQSDACRDFDANTVPQSDTHAFNQSVIFANAKDIVATRSDTETGPALCFGTGW